MDELEDLEDETSVGGSVDWSQYTPSLQKAIEGGLKRGDPSVLKFVVEQQEKSNKREKFEEVTINLVPFEIKDTSLRQIVLKAPDYIVDEIRGALLERDLLDKNKNSA